MSQSASADAVPSQTKHRPKHSGPKKEKKNAKKGSAEISNKDRSKNPKAFAFKSGRKASIQGQRSQEFLQRRLHVPLVDRSGTEPPPSIVAVVGPPKTGKSTLIRSLVKRYTKHNISEINGPITVVAGKNKRLTFIECNNDVNCMLDVAKIADLVILLIDASFGFEMETFEFLNMLQVHGFPKVMGVLNHLDSFKDGKLLRRTKKILKQRFWTEIYQGAKLFYLSGVLHGRYLGNEILNLSRFINNTKYRPLIWRNSHPYVLVDRVEDITESQQIESDPKCDRKVIFYGYARGTSFKPSGGSVHIPGVGDFSVQEINSIADPCPFPDGVKKRTLNYKEKLIYAPMSDVAGVLYDKDAIYISMQSKKEIDEDEIETKQAMEEIGSVMKNVESQSISLFSNSKASLDTERVRRKVEFENEINVDDDDDESDDDNENEDIDNNENDSYSCQENDGSDTEFFSSKPTLQSGSNEKTSSTFSVDMENEDEMSFLHSKFVGNDDYDEAENNLEDNVESLQENSDPDSEQLEKRKESLKQRFNEEYDDSASAATEESTTYYDDLKESMKKQLEMNRTEFQNDSFDLRQRVEGILPGSYIRCIISNVPCEFIQNFNPTYPVLLGGLLPTELSLGFVQARLKKHRWHSKILKTNEPLIFSLGWRRFQSLPLYSMKDATRNRLLKYTPEHMHCMATFYGPITLPNTGLCAFRSIGSSKDDSRSFRISATGVILEIDQQVEIVKKLKLVGYPMQVNKNTAFIKDMFNSALEVSKFEGASLRTVSGIRGQIKKAIREPDGAFRGTFEDKILMSDIVFLRTWYPIFPRKFYNPLSNLLLAKDSGSLTLMRLNKDVRAELGISVQSNPDSHYRPVEREEREFKELRIPKALQRELPFEEKLALAANNKKTTKPQRAVILEEGERKANQLLSQLSALERHRLAKRDIQKTLFKMSIERRQQAEEQRKTDKHAEKRRKIYIKQERIREKKQASKYKE